MKKPTYKRQKALLALLDIFGGRLSKLEFQKYMFLYVEEFSYDKHYGFVPYHYGSFSYELYKDLNTLERNGLLKVDEHHIKSEYRGSIEDVARDEQNSITRFFMQYQNLRGDDLIGYIYNKYPYYAINSKIYNKFISIEELNKYRAKNSDTTLYTIGYESKKFETYLNQLIESNINILVDVRKNAHSMKYGFSKKTLQGAVENLGIKYFHMPNLGIESENRKMLETKEDYQKLFDKYEKTLAYKTNELEYLNSIIEVENRVAITCFEKDVSDCHRGVIAKKINQIYDREIKHL